MVMRMADELKFFEDEALTTPITIVDFKRKDVGETHQLTVYMTNIDKVWPIMNISTSMLDKQLDLDFPEMLSPEQVAPLIITWTPSLDRRVPLDITEVFDAELFWL